MMRMPTASVLLLLAIVCIVLADVSKEHGTQHNNAKEMPTVVMRHRRSMYYAMMEGIGITKEATRWACRVVRTNFCTKFEKTLGIERTRRDTNTKTETKTMDTKAEPRMETKTMDTKAEPRMETKTMDTKAEPRMETKAETKNEATMDTKAETKNEATMDTKTDIRTEPKMETKTEPRTETKTDTNAMGAAAADPAAPAPAAMSVLMMDNIMPNDVGTLLDRTTKELRTTAQMDGFYELSQTAQEHVLLDAAGRQGDIVKTKLKEAIDEARKMVERAIGTIVSYSEVPMESKMAMEQVFLTLTDESKTPKQKADRIKEIEQKWTPAMREALKPSMDEKEITEAARFFSSVPHQIELGKN